MAIDRAARAALASLALLAACATSAPTPDLAAYLERRANCDHFRGEFPDPPDPERMREVENGIAQFCPGSDAQLARLKLRYKDDPSVTKQLAELEPQIESRAK